jgi:DNA mismatch repair protein MutL
VGSNFMVKNLFFNTPARRKFLKADSTEFRHVLNEFFRISLSNPGIAFSLMHNQTELYNLPPANFRQRIVHLFGKSFNQQLVQVNTETSITQVSGYVGTPDIARKTNSEQYFFVNNRYIRHPYLHRAVVQAFERLIGPDQQPAYFICFEMDPASIDINIHPTKTEVKFEDERAIFQILLASVRESLGKHNVLPPLDFDTRGLVDIPVLARHTGDFSEPGIQVNPGFNPFESHTGHRGNSGVESVEHWELLYKGFEKDNHEEPCLIPGFKQEEDSLYPIQPVSPTGLIQFKGKYILTPVKSGLMAIDQRRAHERVLYEKYLHDLSGQKGIAQQSIFPISIDLEAGDEIVLNEILSEVNSLGYDIRPIGPRSFLINGYPADNPGVDPVQFLRELIDEYREAGKRLAQSRAERLAASLAKAAAIPYGKVLDIGEMRDLFDRLFACSSPNITPGGKTILSIIPTADIERQF